MSSDRPKPNRRRQLLIAAGGVLLLLVVGWFVLTSGPVVKALVIPKVATALQADLAVDSVSLSPFSGVELKKVRLTPDGGETLAEIEGVTVRYRLMKLLGGEIAVDEITLNQPRITIHQRADGGGNLNDWLAKLTAGAPAKPESASTAPGAPLQLSIGPIQIKGATVLVTTERADGSKETLSLDSLELAIDQLRNGATTEAKLGFAINLQSTAQGVAAPDALAAKINLGGKLALSPELQPGVADLNLDAAVTSARGQFAQAAGLGANVVVRGTPAKFDELALRFQQNGKSVGGIQASGGYDLASGAGAFDIGVTNLPPAALELAALGSGLRFDLGGFNFTNHITIAGNGGSIGASGGLLINDLVAHQATNGTPTLNLSLRFDAQAELETGLLKLAALDLNASQGGKALITAKVEEPLSFSTKTGAVAAGGGRLALKVTELNPADWRALSGDLPIRGAADLLLEIASTAAGDKLALNSTATLKHEGKAAVELVLNGSIAPAGPSAELNAKLNAALAQLGAAVGVSSNLLRTGTMAVETTIGYTTNRTAVTGTLRVDQFSGELAGANLEQVSVNSPFEVGLGGAALDWKLANLNVTQGGQPALQLNTAGKLDLRDSSGSLELALPLINERLVNPFLAAFTPQQRLRSAEAAVAVKGNFKPGGSQSWSLESRSTNVVLIGTNGSPLAPPLGTRAELSVEIDAAAKAFQVTRWQGTLFADGQSSGQFEATGDIRPDDGRARFDLRITEVNEHAFRPLAPMLIGNKTIEKARLNTVFALDYENTKSSRLKIAVGLDEFRVADATGKPVDAFNSLHVDFDAAMLSNRLDIAQGRFQTSPTERATNVVDLAGWIDFAQANALRGDLAVRSPGLDLTPVYVLFEPAGGSTNGVPTAKPVEPPMASAEPGPMLSLPVDRMDFAIDVRQAYLRELAITNWVANAVVRSNAIHLAPFSLRLNGAPVNARMTMTNDAAGLRYELATEAESLTLAPVMKTFDPDYQGVAEASISTAIHLSGSMKPGENLLAASTGDIFLGVTNANYLPLSPRWRNTLRPVGLLLQTPELFSSPITWAYEHTSISNRVLDLKQLTIMSEAYLMDATLAVPLAEPLTNSVIPRTPVNLYLSRNLITQIGLMKGQTNETSRYVQLPAFMFVKGTFGEPQVETDKLKMTGMAVGKAGDFVGGTTGDVLKKAGGFTEALGGIVSGRKITGAEKGDANAVSKGVEGVFDAVGGIFGGAGKAVEKGTGTVTGTKAVEQDVLATKLTAFDWPRVFTNTSAAK